MVASERNVSDTRIDFFFAYLRGLSVIVINSLLSCGEWKAFNHVVYVEDWTENMSVHPFPAFLQTSWVSFSGVRQVVQWNIQLTWQTLPQ